MSPRWLLTSHFNVFYGDSIAKLFLFLSYSKCHVLKKEKKTKKWKKKMKKKRYLLKRYLIAEIYISLNFIHLVPFVKIRKNFFCICVRNKLYFYDKEIIGTIVIICKLYLFKKWIWKKNFFWSMRYIFGRESTIELVNMVIIMGPAKWPAGLRSSGRSWTWLIEH